MSLGLSYPYIHQGSKPNGSKWRLSLIYYHWISCHSSSMFLTQYLTALQIWLEVCFICTLSSRRQITKHGKTGFLDIHSDINITFYVFICFHPVALNVALKWRFGISSHAIKTQLEIFKTDFTKPSFKHAKVIFPSAAFLYSLSILIVSRMFSKTLNLMIATKAAYLWNKNHQQNLIVMCYK